MRYEITKIERFWTVLLINESGECIHDYRFSTKHEAKAWVRRAQTMDPRLKANK